MRFRTLALALALLALPVVAAAQPSISLEPLRPTVLQPVHVTVTLHIPLGFGPELYFSHVDGNRIVFRHGPIPDPSKLTPPVTTEPWTAETVVGPLQKGFYAVVVEGRGEPVYQRTFEVTEPSPALGLQESEDSAFTLSVSYEPPPGSSYSGTGYGVPLTRESGYVWFFAPENIELTAKILDGRAVNGRYWVFIASMTDVAFTVTIQQCPTSPLVGQPCNVKTYTNPQGVNRNIIDVNAFPDL